MKTWGIGTRGIAGIALAFLIGATVSRGYCPMDMQMRDTGKQVSSGAHACCKTGIAAQAPACCHLGAAELDAITTVALLSVGAPHAAMDAPWRAALPPVVRLPLSFTLTLHDHSPPPTILRV